MHYFCYDNGFGGRWQVVRALKPPLLVPPVLRGRPRCPLGGTWGGTEFSLYQGRDCPA